MKSPAKSNPYARKRTPGRAVARWGVVALVGMGAALAIDLARQAWATDRVQWVQVETVEQWEISATPVAKRHGDYATENVGASVSASEAARPRLVRFTADWCGPCNTMKSRVFSKPNVAEAIHERFVPFNVDLSRPNADQQALGLRYQVAYLPTILIVDDRGEVVDRLDASADAETFLAWLGRGYERWSDQAAPAGPSLSAPGDHAQVDTRLSPVAHTQPVD